MAHGRRLPDPARVHPAGERRPAPRRARMGAALQLPARQRVDRRAEDRRPGVRTDRPARRRHARARPALPRPAARAARAAGRDPRARQPEELDRAPGRVHARAHRPQPSLRRDRARLPRRLYLEVVPRSFAIRVQDRARAQPGAPARPATRAWTTRALARAARAHAAALPRLGAPVPAAELSLGGGLFVSLDVSGPPDGSSATAPRRTACQSTSRGSASSPGATSGNRCTPSAAGASCSSRRSSTCCCRPRASSIPPGYAAEMLAYDPTAGELRTHYAGFFDPGFGYSRGDGAHGSRAALEVRARDVPFMVEHRQPVCKLAFERMAAEPDVLYGEDGRLQLPGPADDAQQALRRADRRARARRPARVTRRWRTLSAPR